MKTFLTLLATFVCTALLTAWLSPDYQKLRRERLNVWIATSCDSVTSAMTAFRTACDGIRSEADLVTARSAYEAARRSYKRLEPLAEYLDNGFVAQFVNGAPLPRLDQKSQYVDILEPQGFQIVDELLHADDSTAMRTLADLRDKVHTLCGNIPDLLLELRGTRWTDRMMIEACRSAVVRISSMGIVAFDRPASEPSMEDDIVSLTTIMTVVDGFRAQLESRTLAERHRKITTLIDEGIADLRHAAFDDFDRITFLRDVMDPLYGALLDVQTDLGIEFVTEVSPFPPAVNPRGRSMFATDFFNPLKSTGLRRDHVSEDLVELGRTLFFDPILSATNERACASCHQPERGFTDGHTKSLALGHDGTIDRNAPTMINAVFARRFFYDLRANRINDVISHVVTNEREFGSTLIDMIGRLRESSEYEAMFAQAFPNERNGAIDVANVGMAIAAYLSSLVSFDSPVDRYVRGEAVVLDPAVKRGFNLFMGRAACGTCHFAPSFAGYVPPSFTDSESEILGVPARPDTIGAVLDTDKGRAAGILREQSVIYANSFKTPTIRNIALTAPYMHNGAYSTLDQIVQFYDLGGGRGIGIEHPYQTLAPDRINLTSKDYQDMIAFMKAITDTTGLTRRPARLPRVDRNRALDQRRVGGDY